MNFYKRCKIYLKKTQYEFNDDIINYFEEDIVLGTGSSTLKLHAIEETDSNTIPTGLSEELHEISLESSKKSTADLTNEATDSILNEPAIKNQYPISPMVSHKTASDSNLALLSSSEIDFYDKFNDRKHQNPDKKAALSSLDDVKKEQKNSTENTSKTSIPDVDKCGTILLSKFQIDQLKKSHSFNQDLPILTLSMAKKLTVAALTGCMNTIQNEIDNVDYYLKTGWRAYKSHKNKKINDLSVHLKPELNFS
jgi:hypothetical protein